MDEFKNDIDDAFREREVIKTEMASGVLYETTRIMAFNDSQKDKGNAILEILKGLSVEDGFELLEKCIFQYAYYGWERKYMTEPLPFGIGPAQNSPESDALNR